MMRSLRMVWPLWRQPALILSALGLTPLMLMLYGHYSKGSILGIALFLPVVSGVWLQILRMDFLALRVLWGAPGFRESYFRAELLIALAVAAIAGAILGATQGVTFGIEGFALALLILVLMDIDHWRSGTAVPAILVCAVVAIGLIKPDWAQAVMELHPLLLSAAAFAASILIRSKSRTTEISRKLVASPKRAWLDSERAGATAHERDTKRSAVHAATDSAERPSLWHASTTEWIRAAYYESNIMSAGTFLMLGAVLIVFMMWAESNFILMAYAILFAGSPHLRLPTCYPLSRGERERIHFVTSQTFLLAAMLSFVACALVAHWIESLWGGNTVDLVGMDGILPNCAVILGLAPMLQTPRRRVGAGAPLRKKGVWLFLSVFLLHFAALLAFVVLHESLRAIPAFWFVIAFPFIAQAVLWRRHRQYFARGDLI